MARSLFRKIYIADLLIPSLTPQDGKWRKIGARYDDGVKVILKVKMCARLLWRQICSFLPSQPLNNISLSFFIFSPPLRRPLHRCWKKRCSRFWRVPSDTFSTFIIFCRIYCPKYFSLFCRRWGKVGISAINYSFKVEGMKWRKWQEWYAEGGRRLRRLAW